MKSFNKLFIPLFWILLLVSGVLSAPPSNLFEVQTGTLSVISGHPSFLKLNSQGAVLFFNVFNSTGGQLNNTKVSCELHLFNITNGVHLEEESMQKFNSEHYEYTINWSKITNTGSYHYIVYCNTTSGVIPVESGYLRNEIQITNTGEEINWENFIIGAVLTLLPLLFAWLILTWALGLSEEHSLIKIFSSLFSLISILFSIAIGTLNVQKFFDWPEMLGILNVQMITMGALALVFLVYWVIYLLELAFKAMAEAKFERLRY